MPNVSRLMALFSIVWYEKSGSMGRALRDFSKMSVYDRTSVLNQRIDDSSIVLKYGEVGDITVELIARFSDKYPVPSILCT